MFGVLQSNVFVFKCFGAIRRGPEVRWVTWYNVQTRIYPPNWGRGSEGTTKSSEGTGKLFWSSGGTQTFFPTSQGTSKYFSCGFNGFNTRRRYKKTRRQVTKKPFLYSTWRILLLWKWHKITFKVIRMMKLWNSKLKLVKGESTYIILQ